MVEADILAVVTLAEEDILVIADIHRTAMPLEHVQVGIAGAGCISDQENARVATAFPATLRTNSARRI